MSQQKTPEMLPNPGEAYAVGLIGTPVTSIFINTGFRAFYLTADVEMCRERRKKP